MRLEEALQVSQVTHKLDNDEDNTGAVIPYWNPRRSICGQTNPWITWRNDTRLQLILAKALDDFQLVWADTLKPISRNPKYIVDISRVYGRDDWEPI